MGRPVRLIRACLGETAIAERKLESGNPLVVLGVEVLLAPEGLTFWPATGKVEKWLAKIDAALASGSLRPGEASKLSGALQWGTQFAFKRLGRAMNRPLFRKSHQWHPKLDGEMMLALAWWREVLSLGIRCVPWPAVCGMPVFGFCALNVQGNAAMEGLRASASASFLRCKKYTTSGGCRAVHVHGFNHLSPLCVASLLAPVVQERLHLLCRYGAEGECLAFLQAQGRQPYYVPGDSEHRLRPFKFRVAACWS